MVSRTRGLRRCGLQALELGVSSCGMWVSVLCGTWGLHRPGMEAVAAELAGGLMTTGPRKSETRTF